MSRIFSGIQPSGELHIGNYLGAVKNWVALQHQHPTIICIVDYHAITVAYDPEQLRTRRREMAVSLLAAGIDPNIAQLLVQSTVQEHTELAWIFNAVAPLGELSGRHSSRQGVAAGERRDRTADVTCAAGTSSYLADRAVGGSRCRLSCSA